MLTGTGSTAVTDVTFGATPFGATPVGAMIVYFGTVSSRSVTAGEGADDRRHREHPEGD